MSQSDGNTTLFGQHHTEKLLACSAIEEYTRPVLVYTHAILNPLVYTSQTNQQGHTKTKQDLLTQPVL